jgi:hypothetical protein
MESIKAGDWVQSIGFGHKYTVLAFHQDSAWCRAINGNYYTFALTEIKKIERFPVGSKVCADGDDDTVWKVVHKHVMPDGRTYALLEDNDACIIREITRLKPAKDLEATNG